MRRLSTSGLSALWRRRLPRRPRRPGRGRTPGVAEQRIEIHELLRPPAGRARRRTRGRRPRCRRRAAPLQLRRPRARRATRWKCVDELITTASTPRPPGGVGDLRRPACPGPGSTSSSRPCRSGPTPCAGRARAPPPAGTPAARCARTAATAAFALQDARIQDLDDRAHGRAGQVLLPDRRPPASARPPRCRRVCGVSTSRYSTGMDDGARWSRPPRPSAPPSPCRARQRGGHRSHRRRPRAPVRRDELCLHRRPSAGFYPRGCAP